MHIVCFSVVAIFTNERYSWNIAKWNISTPGESETEQKTEGTAEGKGILDF